MSQYEYARSSPLGFVDAYGLKSVGAGPCLQCGEERVVFESYTFEYLLGLHEWDDIRRRNKVAGKGPQKDHPDGYQRELSDAEKEKAKQALINQVKANYCCEGSFAFPPGTSCRLHISLEQMWYPPLSAHSGKWEEWRYLETDYEWFGFIPRTYYKRTHIGWWMRSRVSGKFRLTCSVFWGALEHDLGIDRTRVTHPPTEPH